MLLTDVKDPRIGIISITGVSVNPDLSVAHIQYLPMDSKGSGGGVQRDRKVIAEGLKQAAKHMRGPVGRALGARHAPELRFEIDRNLEYAMHMQDVLANLPKPADEVAASPEDAGDDPSVTNPANAGSDE